MKKLLIFVLLGLLFAAPGEVLNQILSRHNLPAFRSTMFSYSVLLVIGYFADKGIGAMFNRSKARMIYYLLFGFLGLMVEWFLLGNAPVREPFQIITAHLAF
jgi:putative flippase GtrA